MTTLIKLINFRYTKHIYVRNHGNHGINDQRETPELAEKKDQGINTKHVTSDQEDRKKHTLQHIQSSHWWWFGLTVMFILLPAVTMVVISVSWIVTDYKHNKHTYTICTWILIILLHLLNLSPVLRYIYCIYYGIKGRYHIWAGEEEKSTHFFGRLMYETTDSSLLRLVECFMEAMPQLVLQIYVICMLQQTGFILTTQIISSLTSLASLAWCLASYHKTLRTILPYKAKMSFIGLILQFLWRFFSIGSRLLTLAMFALRFKVFIFVVIASRWFVMLVAITTISSRSTESSPKQIFFNAAMACIYIFCYINLTEGRSRVKYLIYYLVTLLDDGALIIIWYFSIQMDPVRYHNLAISGVFLFYILGILIQCLYYLCFHPNNTDKAKENIQLCVPLTQLIYSKSRTFKVVTST